MVYLLKNCFITTLVPKSLWFCYTDPAEAVAFIKKFKEKVCTDMRVHNALWKCLITLMSRDAETCPCTTKGNT